MYYLVIELTASILRLPKTLVEFVLARMTCVGSLLLGHQAEGHSQQPMTRKVLPLLLLANIERAMFLGSAFTLFLKKIR